jgi:hypothetical protein
MSGNALSWYSGRGLLRNGLPASSLDRFLREALAGEVTRGPEARPSPLDDPRGSSSLRLERFGGPLDEFFSDASLGQVVPDQGVPGPPLGEDLGAASRKALVVDGTGPNQASHGLAARRRTDLSPREPLGKLLLGEIAPRERACSLGHRLGSNELPANPPRPSAVELDADIQSRRKHGLGRQRPPVLPFEGDLDASAGPREQGANPWRRPLRGQLRPPWLR